MARSLEHLDAHPEEDDGADLEESESNLDWSSNFGADSITYEPRIEESRTVDDLSLRMLSSKLFSNHLNDKFKGDRFGFKFKLNIKKVMNSGDGEEFHFWNIERNPILWVPYPGHYEINPVMRSNEGDQFSNNEPEELQQIICRLAETSVRGENLPKVLLPSELNILNRLIQGRSEGRMLAFKAVLCLKQLILYDSLKGVKMYSDGLELPIRLACWQKVADAAKTYPFLVDTTMMAEKSVTILANLTRQWPFQYIKRDKSCGPEEVDVYAGITVPADNVYIYNTVVARIVPSGIRYPPDQYWILVLNLFDKLGMLDQLFEVLRDTRGLIPAVSRYILSGSNVKPFVLQLNYGQTKSAYTVVPEAYRNKYARQVRLIYNCSPLTPSITTVLLDLLLGYMFWNNLHHLVEELGIGNSRLYPDNCIRNATLIAYGYYGDGPSNQLYTRLIPWVPALCAGGETLLKMVLNYANALQQRLVTEIEADCEDTFKLEEWSFIPLGLYYKRDCRFSSQWALHNKQYLGLKSLQSATVKAALSLEQAKLWSTAVGLDGVALPYGGKLMVRKENNLSEKMRTAWEDLNGEYQLENVTMTLTKSRTVNSSVRTFVRSLFVPRDDCSTNENQLPDQEKIKPNLESCNGMVQ